MNLDLNQFLASKIQEEQLTKLLAISNTSVHSFVAEAIKLCNPASVFVCTDSEEDISYIRQKVLDLGEESHLTIEGHTIHYDGPLDQARDKPNTRFLSDKDLGEKISWTEREAGKEEVLNFLKNSMLGKEMIIRFFSLGPVGSDFSLLCLQITDSLYVAHSEDLLYRTAYCSFEKITKESSFFRFLHSAGELENNVTKNIPSRRIYIDLTDEIVYSVNNQYAGNSVGLKKLAFRLAIQKALREGWLAEHMFLMAIHGPNRRKTYFSGAFPSACGKTSTAMLTGQTIIGDDLAYLKKKDNQVYSVNVESGIFGIIRDVNAEDDPVIWDVLNQPNEVIFSNVLISDGKPYWLGDGREPPAKGKTFIGNWTKETVDVNNNPVPHAHKNARYTVSLYSLTNKDPEIDNQEGVLIKGIFFGGRDSDTSVPIVESFSWSHGVSIGASLESETTAATLGAEGVRTFNPMSIIDFLSVPIGEYLEAYFAFENDLPVPPKIYGTNYFLKNEEGNYITGMLDKLIWVLWSELRVHGEVEAIKTPIGFIPLYDDLKRLFKENLNKDYLKEQYLEQFSIRVPQLLAKIERIETIYSTEKAVPEQFLKELTLQKERLSQAVVSYGEIISPLALLSKQI